MDVETLRNSVAPAQVPAYGPDSQKQHPIKPAKGEMGEQAQALAGPAAKEEGETGANSAKELAVKTAVENANKVLKNSSRKLSFNIHDKTQRIMVTVINTETDEVIREIPPEKVLDHYAKMLELAGLLVDERS